MTKLTIIPADKAIYVNGNALFDFDLTFIPPLIRALQWDGENGHIELNDGTNIKFTELPQWAINAQNLWQIKFDQVNNPSPQPLTQNDFIRAIKQQLDKKAQEKNYESEYSIASYTDSTNQLWQQEAQAFVTWRDAVWLYAYSELALVQAGDKPVPTIEQFLEGLPDLIW